jgi:glucan biosynthesis protein C
MGQRIYFLDNLRTAVIVLAVLGNAAIGFMISPMQQAYVIAGSMDSGQRAIGFDIFVTWLNVFILPVLFFISGYFGASTLRIRLFKPFFQRKWQRIGWPWIFGSLLLAPELAWLKALNSNPDLGFWTFYTQMFWTEDYEQGQFWFLGVLLALFLCLMAAKKLRPNCLRRVTASTLPPWVPIGIILISATASFWLQLLCGNLWFHPLYILVFQPHRLVNGILYFILGVLAFKHRWFTPGGYTPSPYWLVLFALLSVLRYAAPLASMLYLMIGPLINATMAMTALLGLLGAFSTWGNQNGQQAVTLASLSYPLYFLHQTLLQNTAWFLNPLAIPGLMKYVLICAITFIYAYLISKYVLLRLPSFRRQ